MISTLYVLVGLSGSGKSFIANKLSEEKNATVVSSDAIREELYGDYKDQGHNDEVFRVFHNRIKELLLENKNVIADATNITMKSRRSYFEKLSHVNCKIIAYIISRNIEECVKANEKRENKVPEYVIYRQQKQFQIPFFNEGFDDIVICDNNQENHEEDFLSSLDKMEGFNQKTRWHTKSLKDHCDWISNKYDYPILNLSAKWHDIGKIFTQSFGEDGNAHYYGHAEVGTYYILSNYPSLKKFGLDDSDVLLLLTVVNYHILPFTWESLKIQEKWTKIFGKGIYNLLVEFNMYDKQAT